MRCSGYRGGCGFSQNIPDDPCGLVRHRDCQQLRRVSIGQRQLWTSAIGWVRTWRTLDVTRTTRNCRRYGSLIFEMRPRAPCHRLNGSSVSVPARPRTSDRSVTAACCRWWPRWPRRPQGRRRDLSRWPTGRPEKRSELGAVIIYPQNSPRFLWIKEGCCQPRGGAVSARPVSKA